MNTKHASSGRAILSRTINNDNLKVVLLSRHIFSLIAVNFKKILKTRRIFGA